MPGYTFQVKIDNIIICELKHTFYHQYKAISQETPQETLITHKIYLKDKVYLNPHGLSKPVFIAHVEYMRPGYAITFLTSEEMISKNIYLIADFDFKHKFVSLCLENLKGHSVKLKTTAPIAIIKIDNPLILEQIKSQEVDSGNEETEFEHW
jgi:hypothetical protein